MRGMHLGRVARAQGEAGLSVPLEGVRLEAVCLRGPREEPAEGCFYLALEGELVVDLPLGHYVHLRRGEGVAVEAGTPRTLRPVEEAVVLFVSRDDRR